MTKVSAFTEETAPIPTDKVYLVDDPGGTPASRNAQLVNIGKATGGYGDIRVEGNVTETTISASSSDFSNKVQVTVFDTNGGSSQAVTPDHTNDHITIDTAGVYLIVLSVSISGGSNSTISLAFFKNNGATQVGARMTRKIGAGGDVGAGALVACASLSAADTLELWLQNESATTNVTVEDACLCVIKVG